MGIYKYLRETWKNPTLLMRQKLIKWRREPSVLKLEYPTRLDRARSLGYKAKNGIIVARVKVKRGGKKRPMFRAGRKPKNYRRKLLLNKNYQRIAEERANKKFHNMEVLNSYWVGEDAIHRWFEVILIDPSKPEIQADKNLNWICADEQKGRVYRGLTSAGKRSRGILLGKGRGAEKLRPSKRAHEIKRKRLTNKLRTKKF